MKFPKTIRGQIALWATLLILLLLVSFSAFIYFDLSHKLYTSVDDALSLSADQAAAGLDIENGDIVPVEASTSDEIGGEAFTKRGMTMIIFSAQGEVIQSAGPYQNSSALVSSLSERSEFITKRIGESNVRVYIMPVFDNEKLAGWVETLQSLDNVEQSRAALLAPLAFGILAAVFLAGVAGYGLAARAMRPIDNITKAARNISVNDLGTRLNLPDSGDEVSRLASTFDEMLGRLESGFKRERQFTADASHELRTPVAAMEAILSVVGQGKRPAQEYRQAFEDLAQENDRLKGLIDDLLSLARGEEGLELNLEEIDLSLLLTDLADAMRPLADAKGLTINHDMSTHILIKADRDLLIRLFVNLLDNAIKYTEHGGIEISASAEQETAVIKISDSGAGIAAEHLPYIFERFYRADAARSSKGTGLGLAIANQIAIAHEGSLAVTSVVGQGSSFTVRLKR